MRSFKLDISAGVFITVASIVLLIVIGIAVYFESTTCKGWAEKKDSVWLGSKNCPNGTVETKDDIVICSCPTK